MRRPALDENADWADCRESGVLDQVPDHVDAKAVDALAQPEPHHVVDRRAHRRIAPVQIRLLREEGVIVVLSRRCILFPGAAAEFRQPVVRRPAVRPGSRQMYQSRFGLSRELRLR